MPLLLPLDYCAGLGSLLVLEQLHMRVGVLRLAGRYVDAVADFTRALELGPEYGPTIHRGLTYQLMERRDDALADFSRAIELDLDNEDSKFEYAAIQLGRVPAPPATGTFSRHY